MTEQPTTPKRPGRPRKATAPDATTPQESPPPVSKSEVRTQVPGEAEIDVQTAFGVVLMHASLARHMTKDHRMTWGEVRTSLGYGVAGRDEETDSLWNTVYEMAQ